MGASFVGLIASADVAILGICISPISGVAYSNLLSRDVPMTRLRSTISKTAAGRAEFVPSMGLLAALRIRWPVESYAFAKDGTRVSKSTCVMNGKA